MKYTLHIGLVALLATSGACSSDSNPMSPSATPGAGNVAAVPEGTPIRAAKAGNVILASYNGGYGNYTCVDHGGGLS